MGTRQRNFKVMYDKQNRNFLLGKIHLDNTMTMDGAMFSNMKVDTRTSPYTMVWYQPSSGHLFPCVKHLLGQDEVSVNVWHTPGTELKITTNLPHIQSFSVTTSDTTRKMELNGKELVTVDYTPGSHSISQTVVLPTGEHVTVSLSWPRLEMDTTDLEFTVELTPDRKMGGKLGWECSSNHNNKMVYFDIKGSNPYIGDYIIQRNGHYEKISGTEHKLTWTGKAVRQGSSRYVLTDRYQHSDQCQHCQPSCRRQCRQELWWEEVGLHPDERQIHTDQTLSIVIPQIISTIIM